tara:strand:+ start:3911 stop:5884 length:1974 start_codon:yes stop_codon:yes gene_type:complete
MAASFGQGVANALDMWSTMKGREMQNRQLALNEAEEARTVAAIKANERLSLLGPIISKDDISNLDVDNFKASLSKKGSELDAWVGPLLQEQGLVDDDVKITDIRPMLDEAGKPVLDEQGKQLYSVDTDSPKKGKGVITANGTVDDADDVVTLNSDQLYNVANSVYRTKVFAKVDPSKPGLAGAQLAGMQEYIKLHSAEKREKTDRNIRNEVKNMEALESTANATGDRGAMRQGILAMSTAPDGGILTEEDRAANTREMASSIGTSIEEDEPALAVTGREEEVEETGADVSEELQAKEARLAELTSKKGRLFSTRDAQEARKLRQEIATLKQQAKGERPKEETTAETEPSNIVDNAPPEVQEDLNTAANVVVDKSADEIKTAVENNEVPMTEDGARQVATTLKENNVETMEDIARLNRKDRALAIAYVGFMFDTDAQRSEWFKRASNVLETGAASISAKDAQGFALEKGRLEKDLKTLDFNMQKHAQTRIQGFNQESSKVLKAASDFISDSGKGFDSAKAAALMRHPDVTAFLNRATSPDLSLAERKEYQKGANALFSMWAAGKAGDNEWVANVWNQTEGNWTSSDISLRRLIADSTDPDKITEILFTTEPSRRKDGTMQPGEALDEPIKVEQVRNDWGRFAPIVLRQIARNTAFLNP